MAVALNRNLVRKSGSKHENAKSCFVSITITCSGPKKNGHFFHTDRRSMNQVARILSRIAKNQLTVISHSLYHLYLQHQIIFLRFFLYHRYQLLYLAQASPNYRLY